MQDSTLTFYIADPGSVANFIIERNDGHRLSISSSDRSMIHFDREGNTVKDHGRFTSTMQYLLTAEAFLREPAEMLWLGVYRTRREYGGPEEGGWWFTSGELVMGADFYAEIGHAPACYLNAAAADAAHAAMQEGLHLAGYGKEYSVELHEDVLPLSYPAERPHYE